MISRKGEYIPGNVYNQIKEIFIKNGKIRVFWDYIQMNTFLISLLGIYSSEDIPNLTNKEISEINIKCKICTRQLWNDMF